MASPKEGPFIVSTGNNVGQTKRHGRDARLPPRDCSVHVRKAFRSGVGVLRKECWAHVRKITHCRSPKLWLFAEAPKPIQMLETNPKQCRPKSRSLTVDPLERKTTWGSSSTRYVNRCHAVGPTHHKTATPPLFGHLPRELDEELEVKSRNAPGPMSEQSKRHTYKTDKGY